MLSSYICYVWHFNLTYGFCTAFSFLLFYDFMLRIYCCNGFDDGFAFIFAVRSEIEEVLAHY